MCVKADRTVMLLEFLLSKLCTYMYTNDVSTYRKETESVVYYGVADDLVTDLNICNKTLKISIQ